MAINTLVAEEPPQSESANRPSPKFYEYAQKQEKRQRLEAQLTMLELTIGQGQYERAQQIAEQLDSTTFAIPEELVKEIKSICADLAPAAITAQQRWFNEVNSLVKEIRTASLAAKHSSDLDELLMRTAAMQMRRPQRDNVLNQRASGMLDGGVSALRNWIGYLDQKDAGNVKAANELLKSMGNQPTEFPVFTAEDIQARFAQEATGETLTETIKAILERATGPDQLPAALEQWRTAMKGPPGTRSDDNPQAFQQDFEKLEGFSRAFTAMNSGDLDEASRQWKSAEGRGGRADLTRYFSSLALRLKKELLLLRLKPFLTHTAAPEGSPEKIVDELAKRLQNERKYKDLVAVLRLSRELLDPRKSLAGSGAVEHYLAGNRFEAAGDGLMAIVEYRAVLADAGEFSPHEEARQALERLQLKHPEAFKEYEGVVLQELRALKQLLQQLPMRMTPPGYMGPAGYR